MKHDEMVLYERVYEILKNKIESELLPVGSKLPSRAELCKEFHTSEKTVRRALGLLAKEGYLDTGQGRRPSVASDHPVGFKNTVYTLRRADASAANDILKTGILLCYPLNSRGMELCSEEDWEIPDSIVRKMDPARPAEFWRLSNRLWRFFIARIGNELILRTVDSLGFSRLNMLPGTYEIRASYLAGLKRLFQTVRRGGNPESVYFDDLFELCGLSTESRSDGPAYRVSPDAPLRAEPMNLERRLRKPQERYSSVYLDLMSLIAMGHYRRGDRLPSHQELQKIYGVSVDTTIKAIGILRDWGVVTTKRGTGIFVAMDLSGLKKIDIDPGTIASHVRRFLDSLELLSLTVEGAAVHAAEHATRDEARQLCEEMEYAWNGPFVYQLTPLLLLDFLVKHIQYDGLRAVYEFLRRNYQIGRSIPKLVSRVKTPQSREIYRQCVETVHLLMEGKSARFAKAAARMFQNTQRLIVEECKRLGYWDAAMEVYDGSALWK